MTEEIHPPLEEYLEAIHALAEEGTAVIQARIAERLGRSAPSVSAMLDRLEQEGYVVRDGRAVVLTAKGRARAEGVVRKHRLAERLLVDVIGLEWHKAHLEAGRWEHVISDEVEARLVELLGNPSTCPHGNPIPGAPTQASTQIPLADAPAGAPVVLERITEEVELDTQWLRLLDEHGLVPGATLTVGSREADGTMEVVVHGSTVRLPAAMCRRLFVSEPAPAREPAR
jgi:DtxR family Mn-dependent transcriptional regulator